MNSAVFRGLVALHMAFGSYDTGVIERTPVPTLPDGGRREVKRLVTNIVERMQALDRYNEMSHQFAGMVTSGASLSDCARLISEQRKSAEMDNHSDHRRIDQIVADGYGLGENEIESLQKRIVSANDEAVEEEDENESAEVDSVVAFTKDLVSYAVGCLVGRWDVRGGKRYCHTMRHF